MVSTRPPTLKSSSPFNSPLVTVPNAPTTIGIIVTFMFHSCSYYLTRSRHLSFFSLSFSFLLWSASTAKSSIFQALFFCCCWLLKGLVFWSILGDPFVCQSPIWVCVCPFLVQVRGCVIYSFCANLMQLLIMWWMVSSLSPQSLHLLYCCVLSILALIWLVIMALFCAANRRDSVSLLKFPLLSQVQVL